MEYSKLIAKIDDNQRMSTIDVIKTMEIGDYFLVDNSWIQITENHVFLVKNDFLNS